MLEQRSATIIILEKMKECLMVPVVKNLLSNAGDSGSIPGMGTRIPHTRGQLLKSLPSTATEVPALNSPCSARREATKIRSSHTATRFDFNTSHTILLGFPYGTRGKEPICQCSRLRDVGSIPGSGRSPAGKHGCPLHYPCLENLMDRGAWRAIVHEVTKSWTLLKQLSMHSTLSVVFCVQTNL